MLMNLKNDNRNKITEEIKAFVAEENAGQALWQEPIVGFADANDDYIRNLRKIVHPDHQMPDEVLEDASIIIAYFLPFEEWVTKSNTGEPKEGSGKGPATGDLASAQWAQSYEVTNAMMGRLNEHIIDVVHKLGYEAKTAPEAAVFYRDEVMSHWSFRHIAYAAGLGTFGLNNMLITDKGCSGRYNAIVTNLDIEADQPKTEEACLFKKNGTCGLCIKKCPAGALSIDGFDRHKCYEQCLKNAAIHNSYGSSYASGAGGSAADGSDTKVIGSEVCGKCVAGMPCAHKRP